MVNSLNPLFSSFCAQLMIITLLLILFYNYFKKIIFKIAPMLVPYLPFAKNSPYTQIVGAIELTLVALCHVGFCIALINIFHVNSLFICGSINLLSLFYGALIGIGSMGISVLLCTIGMHFMMYFFPTRSPQSLKGWLVVSQAGWMRHHKHTIRMFPLLLGLIIITLQIGSEEIIFRAVIIQQFLAYGTLSAFLVSTVLFILMQIFHMPSFVSAMFPVLGATVMGIIHASLYLRVPSIIPMVVAHLTFFIFTII